MIIDLHIHSKTCSDGNFTVHEIIREAKHRNINLMSITDHDSIGCQKQAQTLAQKNQINYITGVELNITFTSQSNQKPVSLDLLGYKYDPNNTHLRNKLEELTKYRNQRAEKILENINTEFQKTGISNLTKTDFENIQNSVDGTLGRPHIADYLIKQGIVKDRQEAFDKYLVKCDVPKYPLFLEDAASLIRNAGGIVVLAHPSDPHGTSMAKLSSSLSEQTRIIEDNMLQYLDGIECWHSRSTPKITNHYLNFAKKHGLKVTGGSDCHQKPVIMGTVNVPDYVAKQFIN
jgi:predicted metal-dependent phosphoesterase TrpH